MPLASEFIHGNRVRYVPGVAYGDIQHPGCEDGTVSSNNGKYVFVKFDKQVRKLGWSGTTSQSCNPRDLVKNEPSINPEIYFSAEVIEREVFKSLFNENSK